MSLLGFGEIQIGSRNAWNVKYLSSFELSSTRGHSVTGFGNLAVSSIAKMWQNCQEITMEKENLQLIMYDYNIKVLIMNIYMIYVFNLYMPCIFRCSAVIKEHPGEVVEADPSCMGSIQACR